VIPLSWSLVLGAALFAVGLTGLLLRRNALVMIMCIEIMVNAANLNLLAFSQAYGLVTGQALVLFVIGVEAAELAVALAVVAAYHRERGSVDMGAADELRD
jgi:NADH-quinone oxidoreductase subunit K